MSFFSSCGLTCLCVTVLLVLPTQGEFLPNCCTTASTAYIQEAVNACYVQKEDQFCNCKIDAYM
uniref:Chemokine interleukin-8-like domain-containing protein n=1 Tax=Amphiprion ocellaris TaxID=80972 RepID=A0AAQ5ZMX3_AMPOC